MTSTPESDDVCGLDGSSPRLGVPSEFGKNRTLRVSQGLDGVQERRWRHARQKPCSPHISRNNTVEAAPRRRARLNVRFFPFSQTTPITAPAVDRSTVYVQDENGDIYALNANTGGAYWKFATGGGALDTGAGSPVLVDGILYVDDGQGTLFAIDGGSGDELWHLAIGKSYSALRSPAIWDGLLITAASVENSAQGRLDGVLYAIF